MYSLYDHSILVKVVTESGVVGWGETYTIFDKNLKYLNGNLRCEADYFYLPDGPGLGVGPNETVFEHVMAMA